MRKHLHSSRRNSNTKHFLFLGALFLVLTISVVACYQGFNNYKENRYKRLIAKATIQPVKVFQIGFSKCGTSTLSAFFNANGVLSVHHDRGRLPVSIYNNALNNQPLISPMYEQYAVFTDMERIYRDPPINIPVALFKELDRQYPGSKFILNTRNKQAWLLSRATQPILPDKTPLLQVNAKILNKSTDEVMANWSNEWDEHHQAVLEYFKDRPNDLLVYNIETDSPEKITEFFKDYFVLDAKLYGHKNKAADRADQEPQQEQVVELFTKSYPLTGK